MNKIQASHSLLNRKGFTFFELIIVIVVLGILATIAFPLLLNIKKDARYSSMQSDIRNLILAEELYLRKTDNSYGSFSSGSLIDPTTTHTIWQPSSANNIVTSDISTDGWAIKLTSNNLACAYYVGTGTAPQINSLTVEKNQITCGEE